MAADAGELRARATLDNAEFLSALKDMTAQIQAQSEKSAGQIASMTKAFTEMAEAVGAVEIGKKLVEFAADAVDAARELAKLKAGFEAINGATKETAEVFDSIKELQLHSMFDFADTLGPAAKNMMLLGTSAADTKNAMTALVDAASALKQGPDWINAVSGTLANMSAHIVVTQRDMKQLTQEGINAWGDLAAKIGTDVPTAMEMVKKGMVSAQTVTEAVTADLGARFKGAGDMASQTWAGAMHQLSVSGEEAQVAIGNSILKVLNDFAPVLNGIAKLIQEATKWWEGLSAPVQNAVIAFGAALAVVGALSAALPALATVGGAIAAAFGGWAIPIAAAVAGLALLGKWVYDEWPAIKAVFLQLWADISAEWDREWGKIKGWWDGIVNWFSDAAGWFRKNLVDPLLTLFSPLITVWKAEWDAIKTVVSAAWDWIAGKVSGIIQSITGVIDSISKWLNLSTQQGSEFAKLSAVWTKANAEIDANRAATEKQNQAIKDQINVGAAALQQQRLKEAADVVAANAAKAAAAEEKKRNEEAKKAAAEALKYNEDLLKGYNALYAIAPDVAKQFSDMFGGIETDSINAAKVIGKPWDDLSQSQKDLITQTLDLGKAYQTLGSTNIQALAGVVTNQIDAFEKLKNSGTASAGVLTQSFDAIVASMQKVQTALNTDLKKAFDSGLIDATAYYQGVVDNAQKALDAEVARADGTEKSSDRIAAAFQVLQNAVKQQTDATTKAYNDAMAAIGEKTPEQLSKATASWAAYAQTISDRLGADSRQAIEAHIKEVESLIAEFTKMGQAPPDLVKQWLADLKTKLDLLVPAADQVTEALKKIGGVSIASLNKQLADAADQVLRVQELQRQGIATDADVATAKAKVAAIVKQEVDLYNQQYTPAVQKNDQTQQEAAQNVLKSAAQVQQQLTAVGNSAEASAVIQAAAAKQTGDAWERYAVAGLKTLQDAYSTLSLTVPQQIEQSAAKAQAAYDGIVESGTASAVQLQEAWVNNQKIQLASTIQLGGAVTEAQKNELARQEQQVKNSLDIQTSQWKTAYDGIKSSVSTAFDDLGKLLVTGDGSFSQIMTKMWQGIAEAALKGFLEPVTKAIQNFIATTIADLLSPKGLGGILDSLKSIGSTIADVFSGGGGLATSASTMGQVGGAQGMGGAASAAGAATSSLTGLVGAIGSIGSMITGAIGDIQNIHIEKVLGQIEENTRYSRLYLGGRADQGILGVLFKIDEEIAWGATANNLMELKDLFKDWSGPALAAMNGIVGYLQGAIGPYIPDIKGRLEDILAVNQQLLEATTQGLNQLTVTINAGNLTTAEAARQLGNQIAANLTSQLTTIKS